ncbi:hypothetical protein PPERSA_01863 [Pseudocohnilembus persalinus]|uniref:Uncharacterized protein n=1 Tax=Pseudocohnilembus persalinus TaxID=266149 RepID=A0A0V0R245_PSEPJ|nr:hypothetical protein PPERSA_01863 [Pseudocohnilembus persalinus]|eukprot:KRX08610.1 hypothetical protein PPERSA_01863 [Pseudocohnilembus persalinus]
MENKEEQEKYNKAEEFNLKAGQLYLRQKLNEAIQFYEKAIEVYPKNIPKYKLNIAACYLEKGVYDECLAQIQEALIFNQKEKTNKLSEKQIEKLQQRQQKAQFCKNIHDNLLENKHFRENYFTQLKKNENKYVLELLNQLEEKEYQEEKQEILQSQQYGQKQQSQELKQEKNENQTQIQNQNQAQNENKNQNQDEQKNQVLFLKNNININTVRASIIEQKQSPFYPYSYQQPFSLIYNEITGFYDKEIIKQNSLNFLISGGTDIRNLLHTFLDFSKYQPGKKNSIEKLTIKSEFLNQAQNLKEFQFFNLETNTQNFARNIFIIIYILDLIQQINSKILKERENQNTNEKQNENENLNENEKLEENFQKEISKFLAKQTYNIYGFWFSINLFEDQFLNLKNKLDQYIEMIEKLIQDKESQKNFQSDENILILNFLQIPVHSLISVQKEFKRWKTLIESQNLYLQVKNYLKDFVQDVKIEGEKMKKLLNGEVSPKEHFDEDYFIDTKLNTPFFSQQNDEDFKNQFKNITTNFSFIPDVQNLNDTQNTLIKNELSEYEQNDIKKNPGIKNIETQPLLFHKYQQAMVPQLAEEDEFTPAFTFFNYKLDIDQLNNQPDYHSLFNSLIHSYFLSSAQIFRHYVSLFNSCYDSKRGGDTSGAISQLLSDELEEFQKEHAEINLRRYTWDLFRCLSLNEIQDFTSLNMEQESKYQVTNNSYTKNIFNEWKKPDFYKFNSHNDPKVRNRLQQWLQDILLLCVLPPKRVFEENRFPIHFITDLIHQILDNGKFIAQKQIYQGGLPIDPITEGKDKNNFMHIQDISYIKLDLLISLKLNHFTYLHENNLKLVQNLNLIEYQLNYKKELIQFFHKYSQNLTFHSLGALIIKKSINTENQDLNQNYDQIYQDITKNSHNLQEYVQNLQKLTEIQQNNQEILKKEKIYQNSLCHLISQIKNEKDYSISFSIPEIEQNNFNYEIQLIRVDYWRRVTEPIQLNQLNSNNDCNEQI